MLTSSILETSDITKNFGGLAALYKVNVSVKRNSIHAIIGPNGSGKTTFFNVITGMYLPNSGYVKYKGDDITRLACHKIARMGMGRTFQTLCLFGEMSVLENVLIGKQSNSNYSIFENLFLKTKMINEKENIDYAESLLEFWGLVDEKDQSANNLPYGKQKLLEIARAMGMNPDLLLLDEPAAGMNPVETQYLIRKIKEIRNKFDLTVLLIEHNMHLVMHIADEITCLDHGEKICCGLPKYVANDAKVIEAYLGKSRFAFNKH